MRHGNGEEANRFSRLPAIARRLGCAWLRRGRRQGNRPRLIRRAAVRGAKGGSRSAPTAQASGSLMRTERGQPGEDGVWSPSRRQVSRRALDAETQAVTHVTSGDRAQRSGLITT